MLRALCQFLGLPASADIAKISPYLLSDYDNSDEQVAKYHRLPSPDIYLTLHESSALDTDQHPANLYALGDLLNKGAFGEVHTCEDRATGKRFVAKISHPSTEVMVKREVAYLRTFQHPNIVSIVNAYQQTDALWVVLELMDGGDFQGLIEFGGAWHASVVAYALLQGLQAVAHLHRYGAMHRDIKLENFLCGTHGRVKLADFGFAVALTEQEPTRKSICGTAGYRAPEMLDGLAYDCKVDLWSLGIVAMELLQGRYQAWDFCDNEPVSPMATYPSFDSLVEAETTCEFVSRMLDKNPSMRASAEELLQDEFFHQACDAFQFQRFAEERRRENRELEVMEGVI